MMTSWTITTCPGGPGRYEDDMEQTALIPKVKLHHGFWQTRLKPVKVPEAVVICTDPPFSKRTHEGQRSGADPSGPSRIGYDHLTPRRASKFVQSWALRVTRWVLLWTDHVAFQWWERSWQSAGFRTFPPVPWEKMDGGARIHEAGPAPGVEFLFVARAPGWNSKASGMNKPRSYQVRVDREVRPEGFTGMKRTEDVERVLMDYTQPGELVVDPFAGCGSVGVACVQLGRAYMGSECDKETFDFALQRIRGTTMPLVVPSNGREEVTQVDLEAVVEQAAAFDGEEKIAL